MTPSVFVILCTLLIFKICSAELECGVGEVLDNCPDGCQDHCPTNENYDRSCQKSIKCPAQTCKCRFNYSRAKNGTCIATRNCPAFSCSRVNEEFVSCPPYCPTDDCSQASSDGNCPMLGRILIVVQCQPACRCKKGHWRLDGVCVPYDQCPQKDKHESPPFFQFFH